ncbi:MAG: vWA domain-containing protein [Phycisphaerales bacterium]
MTFLAPLPGLVALSIALPLLIALYFLKLRRRPVRVSSTLLWEQSATDLQVNTPLRWLRFSWILLLQVAALLALVAAVARPALDSGRPIAARTFIIVDRSASMSARDGTRGADDLPATRLDEAKRRALEFIDGLAVSASAREATVMTFAVRAEQIVPFTGAADDLREAVRGIEPTDQPGNMNELLRLVAGLQPNAASGGPSNDAAPPPPPTIVLFSDAGSLGDVGRSAAVPGDWRLVRCGPPPSPPASPGTTTRNLAIVAAGAERDREDPASIRLFARLQNNAADAARTTLRVSVDGRPVEGAPPVQVDVPPRGPGGEPGEIGVSVLVPCAEGGIMVAALPGGDALPADDTAALLVAPLRRPRIVLVRDAAPAPAGGIDEVLPTLLGEMEAESFRTMSIEDWNTAASAVSPRGGATTEPSPATADLVVFDRVAPAVPPRVPAISFGAPVTVSGDGGPPREPALRTLAPRAAEPRRAARVLSWVRAHPVLRHVGLDTFMAAPVSAFDAAGVEAARAEVLAETSAGPLIILLGARPSVGDEGAERPRHLAVASEIALTNWAPDVSFPVFLQNAVEFLTARAERDAGQAFTTGQPITVRAAAGTKVISADGPARLSVPVVEMAMAPGVADAGGPLVALGTLERAGLYRCTGARAEDAVLAVNLLDPAESALATADRLELGGISVAGPQGGTSGGGGPREIWPFFVALALLLTTMEWLVYAYVMRS